VKGGGIYIIGRGGGQLAIEWKWRRPFRVSYSVAHPLSPQRDLVAEKYSSEYEKQGRGRGRGGGGEEANEWNLNWNGFELVAELDANRLLGMLWSGEENASPKMMEKIE
jgi:hypothetical protein